MSKVIIAYAQSNDGGDYGPNYMSVEFEVIDEKELSDINKLMKDYFITEWLEDPDFNKPKEWKEGQGALLEFRPFIVRPIRVVKSWELVRTNVGR